MKKRTRFYPRVHVDTAGVVASLRPKPDLVRHRHPRELTAWMQLLALHGHAARRWEPRRLRLRLFTAPATLARAGRTVWLHLADRAPCADLINQAVSRLRQLAAPG